MKSSDPKMLIPGYQWIVYSPDLLGGKPAIKGTRISVALVLESLAVGMTPQQIADDYPGFPPECVPEVLKFAAEEMQQPFKKSRVAS